MFAIQFEPFFIVVFAAVCFGASVGSFLNVVVYRSPRNCVTVNHPTKSFCPRCRRQLRWYENQPILGWLMLRGRCGGCALPISTRYPLVEVLIAVIWVLAAFRSVHGRGFYPVESVCLALACSYFIVSALIDYDLRILPNFITIPGMVLLPVASAFAPMIHRQTHLTELLTPIRESINLGFGVGLDLPLEPTVQWIDLVRDSTFVRQWDANLGTAFVSLAGMAVGAGIIWLILAGGRRVFARPIMGFGDVKFMGFIGALLGPQDTFLVLIGATILGSIGGFVSKIWTGTASIKKSHYDFFLGPINRVLLAPFSATETTHSGCVYLQFGGIGALVARFVGGDSTIAFGPYLAIAAVCAALVPLNWLDRCTQFMIP